MPILRDFATPAGPISHYNNRARFLTYTLCSENHNNMCAENKKYPVLNYVVYSSATCERRNKLEYECTTTNHHL